MDGEGMVRAKTLSVQVFDPKAMGEVGTQGPAARPATAGGARPAGTASGPNPFRAFFSFLSTLGKGFKFGDPRGKAPPKTMSMSATKPATMLA